MRYIIIFIILILTACEKIDDDESPLNINITSERTVFYQYEDVIIYYDVRFFEKGKFTLQTILSNDFDCVYKSMNLDTIDNESCENTCTRSVNLRKLKWDNFNTKTDVCFDSITNNYYYLSILATNLNDNLKNLESRKYYISINNPNPDTSVLNNFIFSDINNSTYNLIEFIDKGRHILLFSFATSCGWSLKELPTIRLVDSLYKKEVQVIGIEGSNTVDINDLKYFIEENNIKYPICLRINNKEFNKIIYPDNLLSFPRLVLIDLNRKKEYVQNGYLENTLDSIEIYLNNAKLFYN